MCEKNQLFINWIEKQYQLGNILTKRGAPHKSLVETVQKSKLQSLETNKKKLR